MVGAELSSRNPVLPGVFPGRRPWHRHVLPSTAAYVLLAETRDGYVHRLRAIGHLHEAEDESQEFRDLHAAIRAARKGYQTDDTIRGWDALAQAAETVRQAGH
jgi:hypothetical protein